MYFATEKICSICYLLFILEGTILGPVVNFYQFDTGMPWCNHIVGRQLLHFSQITGCEQKSRVYIENWKLRLSHFWPGAIMEICPAAWRVEKDTWTQLPG